MRGIVVALTLATLAFAAPSQAATGGLIPAPQSASAPADAPIALASPDRDIARRLMQLFAAVEGLHGIAVEVRGGVVTLTGTVLDSETAANAEALASRVDGVVSVESRLAVEHRLDRRLEPMVAQARVLGAKALALVPLLVVALAVLGAFWMAGILVTRWTNIFRRVVRNRFIEQLLEQIMRLIFILVGLVLAMNIIGATALIGSVLGAAGVIGLAVGFAMRDTIENYIASILLSIRQPFLPNDAVNIEGVDGRITTLNSRATVITTWDGNEVRIPNATVYKAKILNYSRTPERRFEFEMRVLAEADLGCALATAVRAAKSVEGVLAEPAVSSLLDRVEDYAFVLKVLAWVDQRKSDFNKVRSEALRAVKDAFEAEGIALAQPVQAIVQAAAAPVRSRDAPAPAQRRPSADEMQSIADTTADSTIRDKVREQRETADDDLLTEGAARE
ncbi:MAG TPA: mechanosensitive ion channel domain-containing protein [Croceibacterium sp.]|nr:mechanosensitive ion channel domain-containing protein [Croceibacterium sp.]